MTQTGAVPSFDAGRVPGMFPEWWLLAFGYLLAAAYALHLLQLYMNGGWLVGGGGKPLVNDFTYFWVQGRQALLGDAIGLYNPDKYTAIMSALVGADHANAAHFFYPVAAYPPTFFLLLAPFSMPPFIPAWIIWETATLLAYMAVVYLIVRRPAAIALALASPFAYFELYWSTTGFFRASLLGAALLALERRPVLAGAFIGVLSYKPQFGILIPVALVAAGEWRALAAAAATAAALALVSVAAFGAAPWAAFPHELLTQSNLMLLHEIPGAPPWRSVQTIYGCLRALHAGAAAAWLAQAGATAGISIVVFLVWRSPARYRLKAALLSAATLVATPYGWAHDLVAIAIPIAYLAADQMRCGLWRGEQSILCILFVLAAAIVLCGGALPLGPVITTALVGLIMRRVLHDRPPGVANFFETPANAGD